METDQIRDKEMLRRLSRYPKIRSRMVSLLAVVDDEDGDLKRAHDGTMVPTVQTDASEPDRRKGKSVQWQEATVSLKQGLPIGSGEIESVHRYLIQKRLSYPGSWWKSANAEHMLSLTVNRATSNGQWRAYWATTYRYAA
jgi:hypothetical protein